MIETVQRDDHPPEIATLDHHRTADKVRRGRNLRIGGTVVLALFVLAGAIGLLGSRSGYANASANGVDLSLEYGAITRAGMSTPFRMELTQGSGFEGPISIAVERTLFDRFDFQNFYPSPSKETSDADFVLYEFDEPEGSEFVWNFDVRTGPNQMLSWSTYTLQVRDASAQVLAEVDFRIVVVP